MTHTSTLFLHYGALFDVHAGMPNCLVLDSYSEAQWAAFFRFRERLIVVAKHRGGTCIFGRRFQLVGSHRAAPFRLRGRPVVISELRSSIHILGRHFMFRVLGWETRRAAFFSGLKSDRLWLRNSEAAFAS